jgi:hypothetical protein
LVGRKVIQMNHFPVSKLRLWILLFIKKMQNIPLYNKCTYSNHLPFETILLSTISLINASKRPFFFSNAQKLTFFSPKFPFAQIIKNMGILEKIKDIEQEINRTQKNKATEYHLGLLKAKLARYRAQLLEGPKGGKGGGGDGFDVSKAGDGRVAMVGFPRYLSTNIQFVYIFLSVGKSTLLSKLTETQSEVAAYVILRYCFILIF